jgi:hypothetical protein
MKGILTTTALFLAFFSAIGQSGSPVVKAYAYSQVVAPGTIPVLTDEKGNRIEPAANYKPTTNYYIYLETNVATRMTIHAIWIKGKQYNFSQAKVSKTPVMKTVAEDGMKNTDMRLVPKTRNTVIQILPEAPLRVKVSKDIAKDEVVIGYTWKGSTGKYRVKKIKVLAPQMSQ